MTKLATIGYEGSNLADFIAALEAAKVTVLVDVRAVPVSRKKGFSKNQLAAALEDAGIGYVLLAGLGTPKEGRDAAKAGRRDEFRRVYDAHMGTQAFRDDLARAATITGDGGACLMCWERDPAVCHRSIVAALLSETHGFQVRHLDVPETPN
ncbi:MAG: DUF488 family protein [Rhodospirillales bacterium]